MFLKEVDDDLLVMKLDLEGVLAKDEDVELNMFFLAERLLRDLPAPLRLL